MSSISNVAHYSRDPQKTPGILRRPRDRSMSPASRKRNHVRISSSTPTKEFCSDDPVILSRTPPPLTLTDDEFRHKFMPRTPVDA